MKPEELERDKAQRARDEVRKKRERIAWDAELKKVPIVKASPESWSEGVRAISIDELECLGIDKTGRLYWNGRPIEVRTLELPRLERAVAIGAGVAVILTGLVTAWQWGCSIQWLSTAACPTVMRDSENAGTSSKSISLERLS